MGGVAVRNRVRGGTTVLTGVALMALTSPGAAMAQGSGSPPAGGGATDQIVIGTIAALIISGLFVALIAAHRNGRTAVLENLSAFSQRTSGLPGWCSLPLAVAGGSLIIAVLGMYWDISIHIDQGRDEGPFANAAHYLILIGLFGITAAGLLAMALPKQKPSPTSRKLPGPGWQVPLGGFLMFVCAGFALAAFPMDDIWHRIFGQDVTLWGPTHLVLFGAAALSTVGGLILLQEGKQSAEFNNFPPEPGFHRGLTIAMCGAFLIALSTFQGEFDFAVPQFRLDWHPILLMMAAGIGLVTARIVAGKGGALGAALFFILIRGLLSIWVGPVTGGTARPARAADPPGHLRRHRDRHARPGGRVGLVVHLVGAALDGVDAARGRHHLVHRGRGRRCHRRLRRTLAGLPVGPARLASAPARADSGRGDGRRVDLRRSDIAGRPHARDRRAERRDPA